MNKIFFLLSFVATSLYLIAAPAFPSNHSAWNTLLQKHVSENGTVNYVGFKKSESELDAYIKSLKENPPSTSWSKEETMAYWINAYNACTVHLILSKMPINSIMDVNNGKAWDLKFIEIGDELISLNHIEHQILRANFKDARIHFAINCASYSCPKLSNTAFTAANLNGQLELLSRSFINNSTKNILSKSSIKISQLFKWYQADFSSSGSIIAFLNKYSKTKIDASASVQYLEYNWSLND